MNARTKTLLALAAVILLLAIPLRLLLLDTVRKFIVAPLLPLLQVGQLLFQTIPQALLWTLGLLVAVAIALRSLAWRARPTPRKGGAVIAHTGPVQTWVRWFQQQEQGDYFKKRLAHRLGQLAVQALAPYERLTAHQARRLLDHLNAPPEVRAYLQAGFEPEPPALAARFGFLARLRNLMRMRKQRSPLDLDPDEVVQFLERSIGGS